MKFCQKCGMELQDEATVCLGCGCEVTNESSPVQTEVPNAGNKVKFSRRNIILLIIGVVVAAALVVGGFFLLRHIRTANVIDDLAGETFVYLDSKNYPALGEFHYTHKVFKFDDDGTLTYSYYYSNIDAGDTYERSYKIKFKNNMTFLEAGADKYEILYDKYGRIEGIYDVVSDELFE